MATYLSGVTPYIPQIQPFAPDLNFYSGVLDFKQSKTDQGRDQLSTMYGSLLNAPMMRDDNIASRDAFFKTIDQDIKKMSTMDLSKAANVQAASGIFEQMLDNKGIVKDMVWTKNFQKQQGKSESFKNCIDIEKCGGAWWEGGDKALQYKADEFRKATKQDALNFGNANYTPYQDVTKKAMALAKEAGLSISVDQLQGGYITTTKNGPMLVGPLQNLFMGSLGNDPKITEYYKTKAYVDRKEWVYGNEAQYGSTEAAEQAYINEMTPVLDQMFSKSKADIENQVETTSRIKKDVAKKIASDGAMPGSTIAKVYNDLNNQEGGYSSSLAVVEDASNNVNAIAENNNPKYTAEYIDRAMASFGLGQDINAAANTLAYKDYEFKMKEDPYSMEAYRQKNRMILADQRHKNKLELTKYKFDLDQYAEQLVATGGEIYNVGTPTDVMGAADPGNPNSKSYEASQKGFNEFSDDREALKNDLSSSERGIVSDIYKATANAAASGDTQAQTDLVAIVDAMANASMTGDETLSGEGRGSEVRGSGGGGLTGGITPNQGRALKEQLANATTLDQKYAIAKKYGGNINELSGTAVDDMYESTIKGMYDRTGGNEVLRPHLDQVWANTASNRRSIEAKNSALEQMDGWYASEAQEVISKAASTGNYSDFEVDAFESYIDAKGHTVGKEQFVKNMVSKGHSSKVANEMFRGDRRLAMGEDYDSATGEIEGGFWSSVGNVLGSVVDGIGTTVAGVTGELANVLEWVMPWNDLEEGEMGSGWSWWDGTEHLGGWDYDSPTDRANRAGYGAGDAGDTWFGNEDLQMGAPGIHDMWQRAFSENVTPDGDRAWLGINGAGDSYSQGIRFDAADPKFYRSTATIGTTGFLKDAINSGNAIVSMGGPQNSVPGSSMDNGQMILQQLYKDMATMKKGASRPIPTVTYQNIAGEDESMTALNIKFNQPYVNKYKGSEKEPGVLRPYMKELTTEGMTVYLPKSDATNVFAASSQKSYNEQLMSWRGQIDFDGHPNYSKDFRIETDKETGQYHARGKYAIGLDESGNTMWDEIDDVYAFNTPLDRLVSDYDGFLGTIASQNKAIVDAWTLQNGVKDPQQLLNQ